MSTDVTDWLRQGVISACPVLRERDWDRQRKLIVAGITGLLDASVVRAYEPGPGGLLRLSDADVTIELPWAARRMEEELLPRAVAAQRSLLSTHALLDPDLSSLAEQCQSEDIVTHLLLCARTARRMVLSQCTGSGVSDHRSSTDQGSTRTGTRLASRVAATHERSRAFRDDMTGLPNGRALDAELRRHEQTTPFSVLSLDFDGMREANNAFKNYRLGGDVLIRAVGLELAQLAGEHEYAARQHDTGDEFALLLPGVDEPAAAIRARQIEAHLDALRFDDPAPQRVYHGASVGHATRRDGETPGQVLGRATGAMHHRKAERRALRANGRSDD